MRKIVELNLEMLKEKQDDKEDNNIEEEEEVEEEKLPPLTGEEYINILLNYVNENHITIETYNMTSEDIVNAVLSVLKMKK